MTSKLCISQEIKCDSQLLLESPSYDTRLGYQWINFGSILIQYWYKYNLACIKLNTWYYCISNYQIYLVYIHKIALTQFWLLSIILYVC